MKHFLRIASIAALAGAGNVHAQEWQLLPKVRGVEPITFVDPQQGLTMTVRCSQGSGYIDQILNIRGDLDLTPSVRGDGKMINVDVTFPPLEGGLGNLATVVAKEGGYELVVMTTANSMPQIAAQNGRPPKFRMDIGKRAFEVPFVPLAQAERLEQQCDFKWYNYITMAFGMLFYRGR